MKELQKVLQYFLQNFESIAKFQKYYNTYSKILKYWNKYCKISKVLQYFAILLESSLQELERTI